MTQVKIIQITPEELHELLTNAVEVGVRKAIENNIDVDGEFVTREQAAQMLHCSKNTVDAYARGGSLKKHKSGRRVLFRRVDVERLVG